MLPSISTQLSQGPPSPQTPPATHNQRRDPFELPSKEELQRIAARQEARAKELRAARARAHSSSSSAAAGSAKVDEVRVARDDAAKMIQKNYRGYRARRALLGYGLDSSTRWLEVLKDAKYHSDTMPMSRDERLVLSPTADAQVRDRWRRVGAVAHHAGSDDTSASDEGESNDESRQKLERKRTEKSDREKYAKVMGLEYFLEMVDHKHRYGSNLRRYHVEWKKSDTKENFFYWLDYGEGKTLDLEDRPRKRLDTEQVRYLSREERQRYLVHIDEQGRLCWLKDGQPITTSSEFRDSINGIVPADDTTPTWREVTTGEKPEPSPPASPSSSLSSLSTGSHEDNAKYTNTELHDAKGLDKLSHVSVDAVMNHMIRKTTKKNTWIFVADTSFRMYVGIKQSGAFQHSSFLRGARVAAAGLIKIKRGQLRQLSPLSGHYAPPLRNFREFVKAVRREGADMSHVSLSRSYAVLLGLEGYLGAKKRVKDAEQGVKDLVRPDAKREREEKSKDMSRSAQREREVLEAQERERKGQHRTWGFLRRLKSGEGKGGVEGGGGERSGTGTEERETDGLGPSASSAWLPSRSARPGLSPTLSTTQDLTLSPSTTRTDVHSASGEAG